LLELPKEPRFAFKPSNTRRQEQITRIELAGIYTAASGNGRSYAIKRGSPSPPARQSVSSRDFFIAI
jgi:hypothetical protein